VPTVLRSDEPTIDLIVRARRGDTQALDALLQRCLPPLRRWAHGRLPATARGHLDTEDLVQEAAINAVKHLETFDPRHVGAMQAYLRRSVINRIRDEIRRVGRRPLVEELPDDVPDDDLTPLEHLIQQESYERYRAAIQQLRVRDREIIVARVEAQWTVQELAEGLGFRTANAARVATLRALKRLQEAMHAASSVTPPES
jgi:RNA polymerase sigma-70 factor (ECF subfamily)